MSDFKPSQVTGDIDVASQASSVVTTGSVTDIASSTLTTVATMTANGYDHVSRISCSGQESGRWQLFIDTVLIETKRATPGLDVEFAFRNPLVVSPASVLDVKVEHFYAGETPDFEATIYGFNG